MWVDSRAAARASMSRMVLRWPGSIDVPASGRAEPAGMISLIGGRLLIITQVGAQPNTWELCRQQTLQKHHEVWRYRREMDRIAWAMPRGNPHDLAVEVSWDHFAVVVDELHPEIA
jgi:hypothetical protein